MKFNKKTGKVYFTYEDIKNLPEWPETLLLEIVNGDLFVVPSPSVNHQRISSQLEFLLRKHVIDNNLGEILHAPIDVIFSNDNLTIPDLIFVASDNKNIITEKNIRGTPDLIVEILSTNKKRDLVIKKGIYEKFGVKEYVIINPEEKEVSVYVFNEQKRVYSSPKVYLSNETFSLITIPGLVIKVEDIFNHPFKKEHYLKL